MDRIAALSEILAQAPNDTFARYGLAMEYSKQGDFDRALAEFHQAETRGAKLGPREIEAQADAYRIRAQQVESSAPREAWQAAQTARTLYRKVGDFDRAQEHLQELAPIHQPTARKTPTHRSHRWR